VFPVPESWASTKEEAIRIAKVNLKHRLLDNPSSLMFSVDSQEQFEEEPTICAKVKVN